MKNHDIYNNRHYFQGNYIKSCLGFRDKAEQASDLASDYQDTALTTAVGVSHTCCECGRESIIYCVIDR